MYIITILFMAHTDRAIPMIAFPRVRTIYNVHCIYIIYLHSCVDLRVYALYT